MIDAATKLINEIKESNHEYVLVIFIDYEAAIDSL
jgi:hypothetical protein